MPRQHHYSMHSFAYSDVLNWVKRLTGVAPIIEKPKFSRQMVQIALLVIIALVFIYIVAGKWFWENRGQYVWLYALNILLFYAYNISGGQFNRIRGTP